MGRMMRCFLSVSIDANALLLMTGCGAVEFRDILEQLMENISWDDQEILSYAVPQAP